MIQGPILTRQNSPIIVFLRTRWDSIFHIFPFNLKGLFMSGSDKVNVHILQIKVVNQIYKSSTKSKLISLLGKLKYVFNKYDVFNGKDEYVRG